MQGRGGPGGGRDPFSDFGAPFGGFGGHGSFGPGLMSSFFGGRDPFDDPFFTRPFGGMFQSSIFGGSSGFPFPPEMQRSSILDGPSGFPFPQEMQRSGFPFSPNMQRSSILDDPSGFPFPQEMQRSGFPFSPNMQPPEFPFNPNMHPSGFLEHSEPSSRRGPIIQELDSDDENEDATEEKIENPKKHRRSSVEPSVEHPDDEFEGKKIRHLPGRNEYNRFNAQQPQPQPQTRSFSFQSSTVSYGGPNETYYTSSKTRRTGSDGVTLEESKEADSSTRQASHRISRGLHDKGHTLSRKLNPDGKVDTMQTLHNINEEELNGFEEEWKGKGQKYLPGWSGSIGASHSGQAEHAGQGGWLLPSSELSHPAETPEVRGKVSSSLAQERLKTDSKGRGAYCPGRQGRN